MPLSEDCSVEELHYRVQSLEKTLSEVQEREKLFEAREKQALQRERQFARREKAYLKLIRHLRTSSTKQVGLGRKRVIKAEDKVQDIMVKLTDAAVAQVSEGDKKE